MARIRRSARLASASKALDPQAAPSNLESVPEAQDPVHNKTDDSAHHMPCSSPPPRTPGTSSPVKPPMSEMHPSKAHPTMAAPSSALRLGFADIKKPSDKDYQSSPTADLTGRRAAPAAVPPAAAAGLPSSPFTFRVSKAETAAATTTTTSNPGPRPGGPAETGALSARAQRMMDEIREDAQRIKAELAARREQERLLEEAESNGRKIAKAKGKASRFSAVHMAEFRKMDSIENHPSAFRAQQYQHQQQAAGGVGNAAKLTTPLVRGVKRTQSKANLDDSRAPVSSSSASGSASMAPRGPVSSSSSSVRKPNPLFGDEAKSAVKRARQHLDDDASTSRPVSRDGSQIPRPTTAGKDSAGVPRSHSTLSSLMTPTKSSMAKSGLSRTQTNGSISRPLSRPNLAGGIKKSVSTSNLVTEQKETAPVRTPGRFDRVKSILKGHGMGSVTKPKSALPMPSTTGLAKTPSTTSLAKTSSVLSLNKPLPAVPATTPSRKLIKRVVFTPEAKKTAATLLAQNSPSPLKSGIPRSKASLANLRQVHYPSLESVMDGDAEDAVVYPDLSRSLSGSTGSPNASSEPVSDRGSSVLDAAPPAVPSTAVPGTFTFRSDHTIRFGSTSPTGFGATRGQASVRHVRSSILPESAEIMPGSFPTSVADFNGGRMVGGGKGKENCDPQILPAVKHGLANKKRHRASTDDEDEEEDESEARAAKKRRQEPVPDGEALLGPRIVGGASGVSGSSASARKPALSPFRSLQKKPSQIPAVAPGTPSPIKKRATLSLSRLNMLARPKMRK